MPEYSLPYGKTKICFRLPEIYKIDILEPSPFPVLPGLDQKVLSCIENPIDKSYISSFPKSSKIAITINDKTRPVPNEVIIPPLLDYLELLGFNKQNITFFIASGTHTPMPVEEHSLLLSQAILDNYEVIAHDCDNSPMRQLGFTKRGTPIEINSDFMKADIKIVTGNIEPHHFMGYSGGAKSAVIGLASRNTINQNHVMLTDPNAKSGLYETNPMRQDLEEISLKIENMYAYNCVLNQQKDLVDVLFGDPISVMKRGIPIVKKIYSIGIDYLYDMVIVSPGGSPKDINFYQSQKAITHAASIAKDGGWVILLAACPEGSGSLGYEDYIHSMPSHQAVLDDFHPTSFAVGPHKAFQIAKEAVRVNLVIVSELSEDQLIGFHLNSCDPDQLSSFLNNIIADLPIDAKIALMPMGTTTMAHFETMEK